MEVLHTMINSNMYGMKTQLFQQTRNNKQTQLGWKLLWYSQLLHPWCPPWQHMFSAACRWWTCISPHTSVVLERGCEHSGKPCKGTGAWTGHAPLQSAPPAENLELYTVQPNMKPTLYINHWGQDQGFCERCHKMHKSLEGWRGQASMREGGWFNFQPLPP